jgi:hypothetical protein
MRQAPAVRVPCVIAIGWRALPAGLTALASFAVTLWALQWAALSVQMPPPAMLWAFALCLAVAAGVCTYRLTRHEPVTLEWNGASWALWRTGAVAALELPQVDVMIDIGHVLLLRVAQPDGRVCWLTAGVGLPTATLRALCRAAYAKVPGAAQTLLPERPAP